MIIPKEIEYILSLQKRKDTKERILKVYEALLYKKGNNRSYFDCPSAYLFKISYRYNIVMKLFLDHKIIEYKSVNSDYIYKDIFSSKLRNKKFYYPTQSIKYKFLIDVTKGYEEDFNPDTDTLYDNEKWYLRTRYSLLQLGFQPEELLIKRDNFSRRLHTNITGRIPGSKSYREILKGGNYYSIDSKTSQPRLLWMTMKEAGLNDPNLDRIFDNGLDFYDYIIQRIPILSCRDEAKELFTSWINGNGYIDPEKTLIRDIFKVTNMFIRNYKTSSYKDICKLLQHKEASIFIDDLLSNCPVEFCLSVHDSLVVKKEDVDQVLSYCQKRQPELIFNVEEIKPKR